MAFAQTLYTFNQKTVTKIATATTTGIVDKHWRDGRDLQYIAYAQPTGAAAPADAVVIAKGKEMFADHPTQEIISSTEPIDIYVYASREGQTSGQAKLVVSI